MTTHRKTEPAAVKKTAEKAKSAFPAGAGPGRPKGVPNKFTGEVKAMILAALDDAGGSDYLLARARDPKTQGAFLALVGKVLPLQVTGEGGGPIETIGRIELVALSGGNSKG